MDLLILSQLGNLLIYGLLLVGIPALLTWFALRACRPFVAPTRLIQLRWPLFAVLWLLPPAWLYAGYSEFKQRCDHTKPPRVLAKPEQPVRSVLLEQSGLRAFADQQTFSLAKLLESGQLDFVEEAVWPAPNTTYSRYRAAHQRDNADRAVSRFILEAPQPEKVSANPLLPIYVAHLRIKDRDNGQLLAEAAETVFGGGLAGLYLRAIGGDQDYRYLACGYLSPEIGTWRPTLTSDPRYRAYAEADARLVLDTLQP